ncbi:putative uncharacterized protein DDB_G0292292 isoform X1 [Neodiprion virginianus]|uniref:putative uncharacterized protein DDB_G0292292 isoform X1 n=2 Tax=Neodiprion virginianus TaxID=2961670 RepID=UPI001EE74BE2|nr:putative uncharacterized protein DDB_G0292292 isoform X1 [Neodiprion virginianus]
MSRPRRPSVSIHDYPEDLNPFKDAANTPAMQSAVSVELRQGKEPKNKFWTFGRSKKKRSNSFSVKSAWSGLFGKRSKEPEIERRTTITTVSTTYQNGQFSRPVPPPRLARDQQEFEEAFGTFTRRKKYTMESSSHYGSNLTVNGDPARLYNGSPQDTTTSILGELTPKAPARRFGQVSPRSKDEIPPLEFEAKSEAGDTDDREVDEAPVPTKRHSRKQVPRVNVLEAPAEEPLDRDIGSDLTMRDENENLADDFVFRRCSQDAVRRSNLSINSCVSTASGISMSGRKKRRAPQPPQRKESAENHEEKSAAPATPPTELEIKESIDIAKVTEDIQEMTKQSQNIDETILNSSSIREEADGKVKENDSEIATTEVNKDSNDELEEVRLKRKLPSESPREETDDDKDVVMKSDENGNRENRIEVETIEIKRVVDDNIEIIKEVNENSSISADVDLEEVELRKKPSSGGGISRSDSFSVKEQIEQIERQIKELESKHANNNNGSNNNNVNNNSISITDDKKYYEPSETRLSIQANRRSFFKNMVSNEPNGVKIEIKELPREQKDIQVVKLTDPPVPIEAPKEPVKIVELHISEPIKQVPEIVEDVNVNPLPKPRRHSSSQAQSVDLNGESKGIKASNDSSKNGREARGDSL